MASPQASTSEALCRQFSLEEMKLVTQNFSETLVIGQGGFGKVYKGLLDDGTEVAVKKLRYASHQGKSEFWTEIETLCKLRHVHLVSLIGYCNESEEMLLVYDYMPRGTLADHMYKFNYMSQGTFADHMHKFKGLENSPVQWEKRLKMCIGAARGLDYLHTGLVPGIIHRDVKDTNILLTDNFVAKIGDFGLAKLENITQDQSYISTIVKGTIGYVDPEYFMSNRLTNKSDVYSFGVVLLVVLSGRPVLDSTAEGTQHSLVMWAHQCIAEGRVEEMVDKNLTGKISQKSMDEFMEVTKSCLLQQKKGRPTMSHVVARLQQSLEHQQQPSPADTYCVKYNPSKSKMSSTPSGATVENEKPIDQSGSAHINLKVKGQDGNEVFFRIKRSTQLRKPMTAFCESQSQEMSEISFLFDGRFVRAEQTPDELEMEDGDEIDAMLHQTGGVDPCFYIYN